MEKNKPKFSLGDFVVADVYTDEYWYIGIVRAIGFVDDTGFVPLEDASKRHFDLGFTYIVDFFAHTPNELKENKIRALSFYEQATVYYSAKPAGEDFSELGRLESFDLIGKKCIIKTRFAEDKVERAFADIRFSPITQESVGTKTIEILQPFPTITLKDNLKRVLPEQMKLHNFSLQGHFFFDNINWKFDKRINYVIGKNGYGKTFLLQMLASLAYKKRWHEIPEDRQEDIVGLFKNEDMMRGRAAKAQLNFYFKDLDFGFEQQEEVRRAYRPESNSRFSSNLPIVFVPSSRAIDKSRRSIPPKDKEESPDLISKEIEKFLFVGETRSFDDVLSEIVAKGEQNPDELAKNPLVALINQVFKRLGISFRLHSVEKYKRDTREYVLKFINEEEHNLAVPIQKASSGMVSILSLVALIYKGLESFYLSEMPNIRLNTYQEAHGIVVLDEPDMHFHPDLQYSLIGVLLELFPQVQFIVASHSPLITLDAQRGQVFQLEAKEGKYALKAIDHSFQGFPYFALYALYYHAPHLFGKIPWKIYGDWYLNKENYQTLIDILHKEKREGTPPTTLTKEYLYYLAIIDRIIKFQGTPIDDEDAFDDEETTSKPE